MPGFLAVFLVPFASIPAVAQARTCFTGVHTIRFQPAEERFACIYCQLPFKIDDTPAPAPAPPAGRRALSNEPTTTTITINDDSTNDDSTNNIIAIQFSDSATKSSEATETESGDVYGSVKSDMDSSVRPFYDAVSDTVSWPWLFMGRRILEGGK